MDLFLGRKLVFCLAIAAVASAQPLRCNVTKLDHGHQTRYNLLDLPLSHKCNYDWTDANGIIVANEAEYNRTLVTSSDDHSITTTACMEELNYERTCIDGQEHVHTARCIAICTDENERQTGNEDRGFPLIPVFIALAVLLLVICFLNKDRFRRAYEAVDHRVLQYKGPSAPQPDVSTQDEMDEAEQNNHTEHSIV